MKNKISFEINPQLLLSSFEKDIGIHNINFNLLRLMLKDYNLSNIIDDDKFQLHMRNKAKQYQKHKLYTNDTDFKKVYRYLITSHLIYCHSSIDILCKQISQIDVIKDFKNDQKTLFNEINQGDIITRTLNLLICKDEKIQSLNELEPRINLIKTQKIEFTIVDYYRKLRNIETHTTDSTNDELYRALAFTKIQEKYKIQPNNLENLNEDDVKLFSYALLDIANFLCKKIYNFHEEIKPYLSKKYINSKKERKENGIQQTLKQVFLFDDNEINTIMINID